MPRFTDRFIDSLKVEGTQRLEIKDDRCRGLAIRVTARTKTWCFRFKRNGRMQRIKLGEYPIMTLGQAVVAANRRAADLHDGRNPIAESQREAQAAVTRGDELTFNKLADRYLNEYAKPRKKSWKDDEWVLKRARAEFGPRIISTISRRDLVVFLRGLSATSVRNCNKTQASLCTMYNWANLEDETIINPLARIPKIGGKEREEDRVVSDDELRLFWPMLGAPPADTMTAAVGIAVKLIFLTAQRPIQVAGMRVDELVDLEGGAPRWDLPASRMKRPKPHSVPLSAEAVKCINPKHVGRDTSVNRVLVSNDFIYFGGTGPRVPAILKDQRGKRIVHSRVGQSRFDDARLIEQFERWVRSLGEMGYRGPPYEWLTLRKHN